MGSMAEPQDRTVVRALLAAHGIAPPDDELELIATAYPSLRARAAALHEVDCGDGEPAPVLRAREPGGA